MAHSLIDPEMARDIENQERQHPHIWSETSGGDKWVKIKFPYDYKIIRPYLGRLVEECPPDIQRLYFELDYYITIAWKIEPVLTLQLMTNA